MDIDRCALRIVGKSDQSELTESKKEEEREKRSVYVMGFENISSVEVGGSVLFYYFPVASSWTDGSRKGNITGSVNL